jgi:hypothetical protein
MSNADTVQYDLSFVNDLPKREKSKAQRVWEGFQALREATAAKGALVPLPLVAKLLDFSRSRASELAHTGRFDCVEVHGHLYVTEASVVAYAQSERKAGRPPKIPGKRELWKMSKDHAKDMIHGAKNS